MARPANSNVRIEIAESRRREAATAEAPPARNERVSKRRSGWPNRHGLGDAPGARRAARRRDPRAVGSGARLPPAGGEPLAPTGSFRACSSASIVGSAQAAGSGCRTCCLAWYQRTMAIIPARRANASVLTSSPDRPSAACADFYTPAGSGPAIEDFRIGFAGPGALTPDPVLFGLAGWRHAADMGHWLDGIDANSATRRRDPP